MCQFLYLIELHRALISEMGSFLVFSNQIESWSNFIIVVYFSIIIANLDSLFLWRSVYLFLLLIQILAQFLLISFVSCSQKHVHLLNALLSHHFYNRQFTISNTCLQWHFTSHLYLLNFIHNTCHFVNCSITDLRSKPCCWWYPCFERIKFVRIIHASSNSIH